MSKTPKLTKSTLKSSRCIGKLPNDRNISPTFSTLQSKMVKVILSSQAVIGQRK